MAPADGDLSIGWWERLQRRRRRARAANDVYIQKT